MLRTSRKSLGSRFFSRLEAEAEVATGESFARGITSSSCEALLWLAEAVTTAVADAEAPPPLYECTAIALLAFTSVTIVVPFTQLVVAAPAAELLLLLPPLLLHGMALELSATALSFAFGPEQLSSPLSIRPATDTVTRIGPRRLHTID